MSGNVGVFVLYKAMRKLAEKEGDEELLKILSAIIE